MEGRDIGEGAPWLPPPPPLRNWVIMSLPELAPLPLPVPAGDVIDDVTDCDSISCSDGADTGVEEVPGNFGMVTIGWDAEPESWEDLSPMRLMDVREAGVGEERTRVGCLSSIMF